MSVQVSRAIRKRSTPLATPQHEPEADASFDARWAAWIERDHQHDVALKRKLGIALFGAAAIGLLVALFFGVASGAR